MISRASDHVRLGLQIGGGQLCVRGGDDLFSWKCRCPGEQLVSLEDGLYEVTACLLPFEEVGPARIFLHLAAVPALRELGYERVPELFCDPPVW